MAQELTFKLGTEYNISDMVFLRAGYKYLQYGNDLGALSGLTVGLGADIADYYLDYAFTPYGSLGQVHRISLTLHFGRSNLSQKEEILNFLAASLGKLQLQPLIINLGLKKVVEKGGAK